MIELYQLDDDENQLKLLQKACQKSQAFNHHGYSTCDDFLNAIKEEEPSVCVIDLNLTEGAGVGFVVVQAIRKKYGIDLPIFILSRRGNAKDISYALELGITDYILKPIDPLLITEKLKSYIIPKYNSTLPLRDLESHIVGTIKTELRLKKIDNSYFYFESDYYFMKHSKLNFDFKLIKEIFDKDELEFVIHECELNDQNNKYQLIAIATQADQQYLDSITNYLNG